MPFENMYMYVYTYTYMYVYMYMYMYVALTFENMYVYMYIYWQAVRIADASTSTARGALSSPSKSHRASSSRGGNAAHGVRSSWPNARFDGGGGGAFQMRGGRTGSSSVTVDPNVLDVLIGCPASVPKQTQAKLLEVVCRYSHDQTLQLLHHAQRVLKQRQEEGKVTAWPEFTNSIDGEDSTGGGICTPAQELSLAGPQAISIFREKLDVDACGEISEAALVRGLSSWHAAQDKGNAVPPEEVPLDMSKEREKEALPPQRMHSSPRLQSVGETSLDSIPEEWVPALDSGAGANPAAGPTVKPPSTPSDWLASAAASAPSPPVVELRAGQGHVTDRKALTQELKALREKDVLVLQKRLHDVEQAHGEATSRISRAEQREAAVRDHEAAVKLQQAHADERERSVRAREHALSEHEKSMAALRAEVAHKAHELEETARVLQQRQSAVEHREKLLQQQVAHVQKLQELVNRTYEQHDTAINRRPLHSAETQPSTGIKHVTGGGNDGRKVFRSQQQRSVRKSVGVGIPKPQAKEGKISAREKELQALAVLLQSERDRYFAQLQAVERLVDDFDALPNTPGPLLDALRSALYS